MKKLVSIVASALFLVASSSSKVYSEIPVNFEKTPLYKHIMKSDSNLYEKKNEEIQKEIRQEIKQEQGIIKVKEETKIYEPNKPINNSIQKVSRLENLTNPSTFTPDMPLEEAIEILKNSTSPPLSIIVLWKDLENIGIYRNTPIGIDGVSGVKLKTHLDILTRSLSAGSAEKIGYAVEGGAVIIATEDALPQKKITRVYDISDLVSQPSYGQPFMPYGGYGGGMGGYGGYGGGMGGYGGYGGYGGGYGGYGGYGMSYGRGLGIGGGYFGSQANTSYTYPQSYGYSGTGAYGGGYRTNVGRIRTGSSLNVSPNIQRNYISPYSTYNRSQNLVDVINMVTKEK